MQKQATSNTQLRSLTLPQADESKPLMFVTSGWVLNKEKENLAGASDEACCLETCSSHLCAARLQGTKKNAMLPAIESLGLCVCACVL